MIPDTNLFAGETDDWQRTLDLLVETMREMSLQDDPQSMVRSYGARMRQLQQTDGFVALSRRGLEYPWFRVTRSSTWEHPIDPWQEKDRLPLLQGGLMGELLYGDVPRIIEEIQMAVDDPARPYLGDNRSLIAIPHYDRGVGQNMVLMLRKEPAAFQPEQFPDWVWMSSLFGRATQNLVLSAELKKAYDVVERELKVVADIQRSLLPTSIPAIPTLSVATFYQTSQWAGGDYYDFFPLPDGKWGLLIADVSGHGTPAAVLMAVTHSLAHGFPGPHDPPSALLAKVNHQLATLYTATNEAFVTAFYGIYDPTTRLLSYSSAGHNPASAQAVRDLHHRVARRGAEPPPGPGGRRGVPRLQRVPSARRPPGVLHRRDHRSHRPGRSDVRHRPPGRRALPLRRNRAKPGRRRGHRGQSLHRGRSPRRRPDPVRDDCLLKSSQSGTKELTTWTRAPSPGDNEWDQWASPQEGVGRFVR